ncbi:DNA-binding HxlR family transcriptional regulator [Sphingomonas naasensis]|uniref:Transcriptional regulator n=1 Tax=Sphingomonas naasensis TaxID=1344951 RepID=A0A4S1WSX2_9SPHN|nr:helix-turn-helix domain-containing protein [Sphingomonas naasensis]NIJ19345.1 DNA-binding HxlR family transcriptional regulator [Sphingomonas naasensis]TGX46514.1 transcriptional regulator [Sphingomonas naasensis]
MELTATAALVPIDHRGERCIAIARHLAWIGDRWTLPVVVTLDDGPLRFNQLRRAVSGISQQMLTRTLRGLERDGIVSRTVHPTVPPQVEYALTPLGNSLADQARQLGGWVQTNLPALTANRAAFDAGV